MSLLFCSAVHQISEMDDESLEILDTSGLDVQSLTFMADQNEKCEVIMQWIQQLIVEKYNTGVLNVAPPILSRVFQELSNGYTNVNSARSITDVPFPFPYAQLITVMLLIMSVLMPVIATFVLQVFWLAGPLTFIIVFGFWCINYIAMEIEMPFGKDTNDLSMRLMVENMNCSLLCLLDERTKRPPKVLFQTIRFSERMYWGGGKRSLIDDMQQAPEPSRAPECCPESVDSEPPATSLGGSNPGSGHWEE